MSMRSRLWDLGKKYVDLIPELKERGWTVQQSELSQFVNERVTTPKAKSVLAMCDEIIKEWEKAKAKTKAKTKAKAK